MAPSCPACRETACDEHMCSACLGCMMIYGADVAKTGSVMMVCPHCGGSGLEPEGDTVPSAPTPDSTCGTCSAEIGYEHATLCLGCDQPFHTEGCFGAHECPAVVRADAAKLGAWEQATKGWSAGA